MPKVNPAILHWARETAGPTLEEAAEKVGIGPARGITGAERLSMLERGEAEPSRPVLLKMANQYRRPLLTFYMAEPPQPVASGQDFRTLPEHYARDEALVSALLREVRARQEMVRTFWKLRTRLFSCPSSAPSTGATAPMRWPTRSSEHYLSIYRTSGEVRGPAHPKDLHTCANGSRRLASSSY